MATTTMFAKDRNEDVDADGDGDGGVGSKDILSRH